MSFGYQILGFGSGGSPPPTITDISGKILVGTASNLTLTGTNFGTANLVVKFVQASDSISETVSVTPTSLTNSGAVAVPAAVYNNVTADNAVDISVTNEFSKESTVTQTTALGLPTGGNITTSGNYRIHTFTSSGTFGNTISNLAAEYLVIAGGGSSPAGANATGTGGGGAGGYRTNVSGQTSGGQSSAESSLSLSTGNKTVTVGAGGSSGGNNGADSVFDSITSTGGGHGGGYNYKTNASGGSGGGGAYQAGSGASGTSGQGHDGGQGTTGGGGGGGGAGAVGGNAPSNGTGGDGGNGLSSNITGSDVTRGGGGGGGAHTGYGGGSDSSGGTGGGGFGGRTVSLCECMYRIRPLSFYF